MALANQQPPTPPTPPTTPGVTAQDMQTAVAAGIEAQMKPILAHLGSQIGKGIAEAMEAHSPKKVLFGRYWANSVYHPDKANAKRFSRGRVYFQCGARLSESNCFDNEVHLLNQISHSGTYVQGNVTVAISRNGEDEQVSISWPCHTADIRSEMKDRFRNFKECLELVLAEQAQEREKAERQVAFERHLAAGNFNQASV